MALNVNAKAEWLEDKSGQILAPYTLLDCIFDKNGTNLASMISDYWALKDQIESIQQEIEEYVKFRSLLAIDNTYYLMDDDESQFIVDDDIRSIITSNLWEPVNVWDSSQSSDDSVEEATTTE